MSHDDDSDDQDLSGRKARLLRLAIKENVEDADISGFKEKTENHVAALRACNKTHVMMVWTRSV
jgi:hypothetical protein